MSRLWSSALASLVIVVLGAAPADAAYFSAAPDDALSWVPNGRVYDIEVTADTVYVVGTFTSVRNPVTGQKATRNRAVAFDRLTGALQPWNPNADNRIRSVEVSGGTAYLGGVFTTVGGQPRLRLAAVDAATGEVAPDFVADTSGEVRDLYAEGGSLWVAGVHGQVNGVSRGGLTKVDAVTGAVDTSFNARVGSGRLFALERGPDDTLILGGNFKLLGGVAHAFLGAVRMGTGVRVDWTPDGVCGTCTIFDLARQGPTLAVAVGGGGGGRAAVWSLPSGAPWPARWSWVRRGDGDVQAVALRQGVMYAGGHFGPVFDSREEHQLVTLDAASGTRLPYSVPFTGNDYPGLWAVEAQDDFLWIGGVHQGIAGSSSARYTVLPAASPTDPGTTP